MKLGLILHDPEESTDCFSDNTHQSHYYDQSACGMFTWVAISGWMAALLKAPRCQTCVKARNPALDTEMRARLDASIAALDRIRERAAAGEHYDQLIGSGNATGNALIQAAIDALIAQTRSTERVVQALGLATLTIEGSESLDNPDVVFQ